MAEVRDARRCAEVRDARDKTYLLSTPSTCAPWTRFPPNCDEIECTQSHVRGGDEEIEFASASAHNVLEVHVGSVAVVEEELGSMKDKVQLAFENTPGPESFAKTDISAMTDIPKKLPPLILTPAMQQRSLSLANSFPQITLSDVPLQMVGSPARALRRAPSLAAEMELHQTVSDVQRSLTPTSESQQPHGHDHTAMVERLAPLPSSGPRRQQNPPPPSEAPRLLGRTSSAVQLDKMMEASSKARLEKIKQAGQKRTACTHGTPNTFAMFHGGYRS